ncbi:solute carrier family 23 protein, partial [Staphylococcus auricularis]|uniref:solute carrier family 23 protein n=1 Tax=Staphylococcus auricularis TaxID=29379 RepID=UPI002982877C
MFQNSNHIKGYNFTYLLLPIITLLLTISIQPFFKRFLSLIPVFIPIITPYLISIFIPLINFQPIPKAKSLHFPHIYIPFNHYTPSFHLPLLLLIIPILFVTLTQHIPHQLLINKILGKNFFKHPRLHRSI